MRITTFVFRDATFEVAEDTVSAGMDGEYIAVLLCDEGASNREFGRATECGILVATVSVRDGDPGFVIPSADAAVDELRAFYTLFLGLPRQFRNLWNAARARLAQGVDAELTPGLEKKDSLTPDTGASDTSFSPQ